jgi:hypothetical protein
MRKTIATHARAIFFSSFGKENLKRDGLCQLCSFFPVLLQLSNHEVINPGKLEKML